MKVLVTGSSGRIGRTLVKALLSHNYSVRGYDVRPPDEAEASSAYEFIQGQLLDSEKVAEAVQGVDAVIHVAGLILYDDRQSRLIIDTNLRCTFEVLEAMARSGQRFHRFIYASSGQVYPDAHPLYVPVDEGHPYLPDQYYGYAKLASEQMAWFYQRKWGIPAVCLRFAHVQDPAELIDPESEWSGPRFFLSKRLALLKRMDPKSREIEETIRRLEAVSDGAKQLLLMCSPEGRPYEMTIAHTQDIVNGILLALEKDRAIGEAYNLGPAGSFDFGEAIPYMAQKLGMPYARVNMLLRPYHFQTSIAKARMHLGYQPRYDAFAMIDEAVAGRGKG